MTYLFVFTFGPVQSFIAQARKAFDLYAGSTLLSKLSKMVIDEANKDVRCEIIFPNKNNETPPNRFLAELKFEKDEEVKKFGENLAKFLQSRFKDIFNEIFDKVPKDTDDTDDTNDTRKIAEYQIDNFLEIYWAGLKIDKFSKEKYNEIESKLGSIKNIKQFNPFSVKKDRKNNEKKEEQGYRKCTQCGIRDAIFYVKENGKPTYIHKLAIKIDTKNLKIFKKNESLCSICLMKRLLEKSEIISVRSFPSTSEIAQFNLISEIENDEDLQNFKIVLELALGSFDYQYLYEGAYDIAKKEILHDQLEHADELFKKISRKIKGLKENKNIIQTPYYGIIAYDGDDMGKWVSGEYLENNSKITDFHNEITKKLSDFEKDVEKYFKEPKGKLVYCGGDDVLGFLNINYIFDIAEYLRKEYPQFENNPNVKEKYKSTGSCGICISHYKSPLSEALNWARKAEKMAKVDGKDAFCIVLLKRSGEIEKFTLKWDLRDYNKNAGRKSEAISNIKKILQSIIKDHFSHSLISNVEQSVLKLYNINYDPKFDKNLNNELKILIKQNIIRSCQIKKENEETNGDYEKRKKEEINNLLETFMYFVNRINNVNEFLSFLNFIRFMSREAYIK